MSKINTAASLFALVVFSQLAVHHAVVGTAYENRSRGIEVLTATLGCLLLLKFATRKRVVS